MSADKVPSLEIGKICEALSDMAALVASMTFAHGDNQMAQAITSKHTIAVERARRWTLTRCPVCDDMACETKSDKCGK